MDTAAIHLSVKNGEGDLYEGNVRTVQLWWPHEKHETHDAVLVQLVGMFTPSQGASVFMTHVDATCTPPVELFAQSAGVRSFLAMVPPGIVAAHASAATAVILRIHVQSAQVRNMGNLLTVNC